MVEMNVVLKASSENLNSKHVFPTPESPINSNLNNRSYVFFAILVHPNFVSQYGGNTEMNFNNCFKIQTTGNLPRELDEINFYGNTVFYVKAHVIYNKHKTTCEIRLLTSGSVSNTNRG